jgi:hypothetical protein
MKILRLFVLQMLTVFVHMSANAQDATVEGNFTNVTFAIQVGTNVVTTNVDFYLTAVITNSSSVSIGKTDRDRTSLSLTDNAGHAYEFYLKRADWDNMISHRISDAILPNSAYEWPLYIDLNDNIFDKRVVPGTYELQAACEFFVPNKTYRVISNPIAVNIVAKP